MHGLLAETAGTAEEMAETAPEPIDIPVPGETGMAETYFPEDFARFAPRSALDLLERVPGFTIQSEDDARGLGQASGNILINGERLSSKSDSAKDQLARISASNVTRIEIVDGASLDLPGLSGRVANIVTQSGGLSGQFQWDIQTPTTYADGSILAGKLSVSGTSGPVDYTLGLANPAFRGGSGGPGIISNAGGTVVENRFGRSKTDQDNPKLSGSFKFDGPGSSVGNLNLSYKWNRFKFLELDDRERVNQPDSFSTINTKDTGHEYEISGDFEFPLGPGRLKLIGLERFERSDFGTQAVIDFEDGAPPAGDRFELLSESGERIGRGEYRWPMLGGDWQFSFEGAFNRLDNVASLYVLDPSGSFREIAFPGGTGGVTEDRYEAILSYGRPLSSNLTMQLALGGEYSTIAQTGPNAEERSFRRPKGSLSLAWAASDSLDVSLELRRAVGQLDFADFLAEVDLEDEIANAGNNQLVPQQSWEAQLELAKDFGAWGSATLTLYHHRIKDYVTIVPLPGGVESQGNIDSARASGIKFDGTLQLDQAGFAGARLDVVAEWEDSRLVDPVTQEGRPFDYSEQHNYAVDFRHDIPRSDLAWGLEFRDTKYAPYYRLFEAGYDYSIGTFGGAFMEHKDVFGLTARLRLANALGGSSVFNRTVYTGPRGAAPIAFFEDRDRKVGYFWNIIVKGSF